MSNNRPGRPNRKLTFVAPVSIIGVLAAILLFTWISRRQEPPPPPAPPVSPQIAAPVPKVLPPMDRAALILVADAASADYAAGAPAAPPGKDALVGRPFDVRLPFGCEGPQIGPAGAQAYYELDGQKQTVRLVARPNAWGSLPVVHDAGAGAYAEAVEGFWIPRPWLLTNGCPARRDRAPPATPTAVASPYLGLAQIFSKDGSRVLRRGERPYEYVGKVPEGAAPLSARSYRLVLQGKLASFPDGRAAHCWSESGDHQPICIYAVTFERVAFEDPRDGSVLAEWRD